MADGTTSTDPYSKALQQTLGGTPGQPGWLGQGLGFSQADIAALQQAGISVSDLQSMQLVGGPTTTSPGYGGSGGQAGTGQSVTAYTPQQQQYSALLRAMLKIGGGGQQQQQQPPPGNAYGQAYPLYAQDAQGNPTGKPIYANPTNQANLLGAAALQMPAVINPPPSAALDPRSGVSKVGGALIGSTVPSTGGWTWNSVGQSFGLSANGIADFQAQGMTPQQVADKFNATWNPITERATQAAGIGSDDIARFKAQGLNPQQVAAKFGVQTGLPTPSATPGMLGPWTEQPGIFKQAARVAPTLAAGATPLTAAVQPTATAYNPTATPFAQAPPAPSVTPPTISPTFLAAHTSGLEDAGKAIFAHFGGDPNTATHADIANFHTQLTSAIGGSPMANPLASGPPQPIPWQQAWAGQHGLTNPTPGSPAVQLPPGVTPPYAGFAPSSGFNPQPWLTSTRPPPPGMPASPAAAIAAASGPMGMSASNTAAALAGLQGAPPSATKKMQRGGVVPGRGNKDTVPALLTPGEYVIPKDQVPAYLKMQSGGVVPGDPDPDPNAPPEARRKTLSAQTSQAPPPAAPGGSSLHSGLVPGLATAAQTYASSMANLPRNPIGSGSGVDIRNTRLDPDPDLPYLKAAGMLGGGGMSSGMKSALGGIGSGLTQAAQAIASSVGPWQMQQNAIPTPPPAPAAPQFTQPQVSQQAQQGVNPYAAYVANQARYPTSPYYT